MKRVMIDTHLVIWLYTGAVEEISIKAQKYIESHELMVSPIVLLELQYLLEIGRLKVAPEKVYDDLHFRIGLHIEQETLWSLIIKEAFSLSWTKDPFDRLIVAHASVLKCSLISRDRLIGAKFTKTIW